MHDELPTGRAVSLVWGSNRSLVADLGAATLCRPDRVFTPHNLALLTSARLVYIEVGGPGGLRAVVWRGMDSSSGVVRGYGAATSKEACWC